MKKLFFTCAMMCAFCVTGAYAQTSFDGSVSKTSKYYGWSASGSTDNPCKGVCIFKCGEKSEIFHKLEPAPDISGSTAVTFGMDYPQTLVKTVLKDANGNVLDEREEVYDGDIDTVVQQYVTEETRKGAIVE